MLLLRMKKVLIFIFILPFALYSKNLVFLAKDIKVINSSPYKKQILKRIENYENLKYKIKDFSVIRKLSHINSFYNKILPQNDKQKYGINDFWSTRKEFLIAGKGDCEDYAIAKYFSLIEVGIPKEKLYLAIVKVKGAPSDHMVLFYLKNKNTIPLVIDNLSFKVVPLTKRKKLEPVVIFNENDSYVLKNSFLSKKVKINWENNNKWAKLLEKVYKYNR